MEQSTNLWYLIATVAVDNQYQQKLLLIAAVF